MSDQQKRGFLNDFVNKARSIGLSKTIEILIPCLVNAFNSDEVIHPDIYDAHAAILFSNMNDFIDYLGKEGRKKIGSDCTSEQSESDMGDSDGGEVSGYQAIHTLVKQIYAEFF